MTAEQQEFLSSTSSKHIVVVKPFRPTPRELGHQAAEAAEKNAGDQWKDMALDFLTKYARAATAPFLAIDVRREARGKIPEPSETRAWGGVFLRAKKAGIIAAVGQHDAPHVHGSLVTKWVAGPVLSEIEVGQP